MISLGFLAFSGSALAEESIESIIQKHVVETCDKLNKPKLNTCDKRDLTPSSELPKEGAVIDNTPSQNRSRCDRDRQDAPAQTQVPNFLERSFNVSALSKNEAQEVFSYVRKQKSRYALGQGRTSTYACVQRAELIANDILEDCKIQSAKIFAFPSRNLLFLGLAKNDLVTTVNGKTYTWPDHHVANIIYVKDGAQTVPYVIDPLLFDRPVPQATWEQALRQSDTRASTRITSSAIYRPSFAYDDDKPGDRPQSKAQAIRDLEELRQQTRILNRGKGN